MGTCPPGAEELYRTIALLKTFSFPNVPILLDGYKGVLPVLETGVWLPHSTHFSSSPTHTHNHTITHTYTGHVSILKINVRELQQLCADAGLECYGDDHSEAAAWLHASPNHTLRTLMCRFTLDVIALTDGPRPAFLFHRTEGDIKAWTYALPSIPVLNAIGCGDTAAGGLLHYILEGHPPAQAFRCALAMASAAACTDSSAFFEVALADEIVAEIKMDPIP
jgi:sugar/nucleoside kinase (ribokinase family)